MKSPVERSPHPDNPRLLISFAHPDDEAFGMGGAIALYAQQGANISLICATNGDVGTVDPESMAGYQSIAELRLAELGCAAETLGIRRVITFGYRDSGMMGAPENDHPDCLWQADGDVVAGRIVHEIRQFRPQVVVTFDPFGGYGHPDHIYMHRATTRAFHAAGDPAQYPDQLAEGLEPYSPAKLYYTAFPRLPLRVWLWQVRLSGGDPRRMGKNQDLDLQAALDNRLPTHARLNIGAHRQTWDDAARCHASQQNPRESHGLLDRLLSRLIYRHQDFTRAWPQPNGRHHVEHDLFEGIR
ncbi:MAG: PIG-L family deacetylase [Anaerolineae bacterium]|jgi:mycothiol S-conjugate amidase|nr:PIG-L family deacetylase [Anaerolineae bacterium]